MRKVRRASVLPRYSSSESISTATMASEGASWGEDEYGATEDIHTEHSDQQVDDNDPDPRDSGEEADTGAEDVEDMDDAQDEAQDDEVDEEGDGDADGGDYDPESVTIDAAPPVPDTTSIASQRPASKPKMSGGFLVEVSDDEDDDDATPQSGATALPEERTVQSAEILNGAPAAPVGVPSHFVSAPLGIDPLMMLEARIKEDPRGDMDAWLNLIADYRRRNRLDDARSVYNRFFDVFPNAVSPSHASFCIKAD